jgi:hypothetical protein
MSVVDAVLKAFLKRTYAPLDPTEAQVGAEVVYIHPTTLSIATARIVDVERPTAKGCGVPEGVTVRFGNGTERSTVLERLHTRRGPS